MVDQRRQIITKSHKLNILLHPHQAQNDTCTDRGSSHHTSMRNVDAASRGTVPRPKPSKPIERRRSYA